MASATCSRMADPAGAPSGVFDAASGAASGAVCGTSRAASGVFDAAAISSSAVIAAGAAAAKLPFCSSAALCPTPAERLPSASPNVSSICRGSCPSRPAAPLLLFSSVIPCSSRSRSLWSCFLILSGYPRLSRCLLHFVSGLFLLPRFRLSLCHFCHSSGCRSLKPGSISPAAALN